ncbi:MAG: metalloregulator ArsR/SmtB family transcription factor [Coriobacteriales bacterium]|jgi:ArsR family transcriptional regulator|nr:metalloregulator ArsR/SmtB family transcription factor [Coriobacteriales bacterium]
MDLHEGIQLRQFRETRRLLIAIGDETRQEILVTLSGEDCQNGMRVGDIAAKTHLSRPSVSHHLKILLDAEVLGRRSEGTRNYYYLLLGGAWPTLVELVNHIERLRREHKK